MAFHWRETQEGNYQEKIILSPLYLFGKTIHLISVLKRISSKNPVYNLAIIWNFNVLRSSDFACNMWLWFSNGTAFSSSHSLPISSIHIECSFVHHTTNSTILQSYNSIYTWKVCTDTLRISSTQQKDVNRSLHYLSFRVTVLKELYKLSAPWYICLLWESTHVRTRRITERQTRTQQIYWWDVAKSETAICNALQLKSFYSTADEKTRF